MMAPLPPFDDTAEVSVPAKDNHNTSGAVATLTSSVHSNSASSRRQTQKQEQFQRQQQLVGASVRSGSSRRRSSVCSIHSALMEDEQSHLDCTICLDRMHMVDYKHPLQCEFRQCGFNFCMNCIESLITSSKDDFQMSSDGNRHVKVYLHCPNCRSDLGWTIRDTLLLRKADFILMNEHLSDSQLSASQLRLKHEIHKPQVQQAIQTARKLEAEFFGKQLESIHSKAAENAAATSSSSRSNSLRSSRNDEEWGVEADLLNGVHSSIHLPKGQLLSMEPEPVQADKTLLQGLDYAMTEGTSSYFSRKSFFYFLSASTTSSSVEA